MRIALSPCPNDTYLFHAWIEGFVGQELPCTSYFADIQTLNEWALNGTFSLIKLSFPCFEKVQNTYQLLSIGAALGQNCGPKLIAKTPFDLKDLPSKTVAIPGQQTTAHLLLSRLLPHPKQKIFCAYHEVMKRINKGEADCGLIIHELRFTYQRAGFCELADLGELWHRTTGTLLPLGGLAILRTLPDKEKKEVLTILRQSLFFARTNPEKGLSFITHHSQEKEESVVRNHISTYVTEETEALSSQGKRAIETLIVCNHADWLYSGI